MKTVIFACVQNAGRSQMAAAFFNALADPAKVRAVSAGTRPAAHVHPEVITAMREAGLDLAAHVHPEVITAMREAGLDLSRAVPRKLTAELARDTAWLITMGCGEDCPVLPGVRREDWPLPDPHGKEMEAVRSIRDAIRAKVEAFIADHGWR
jgi:arsenate reductase